MALWPASLGLLIVGTVVFDLGVQASLIAHQTIIYGLDGAARSRLNAILVSSMFLGMSLGAAVASSMLSRHGWAGVMLLGAGTSAAALVVRYWPAKR
jgi:predicted MFS family arabinose efflux permease